MAAAKQQQLRCVVVSVDSSEESMKALRWALNHIKLNGPEDATLVILHVQSPPSIAAGLNPAAIPFGGRSSPEVPAFSAAIEAHLKRISEAIIDHAMGICSEMNNVSRKCKQLLHQSSTVPSDGSQGFYLKIFSWS